MSWKLIGFHRKFASTCLNQLIFCSARPRTALQTSSARRKLLKKLSHKSCGQSCTSQHLKLLVCLTDFGMFVLVFCWKLLNWGQIEASTWLRFFYCPVGRRPRFSDFCPQLVLLSNKKNVVQKVCQTTCFSHIQLDRNQVCWKLGEATRWRTYWSWFGS